MRYLPTLALAVLTLGCPGPKSGPSDSGTPPDAGSCAGLKRILIGPPANVSGLASDGLNAYFAIRLPDAGISIDTLPLSGGNITALLTATDVTALISNGQAIYFTDWTPGGTQIHRLSAGNDTILGWVGTTTAASLAVNSTDVYVSGSSSASQNDLWRIVPDGGPSTAGQIVTTIATSNNPGAYDLVAGNTGAMAIGPGLWTAPLPGPSSANLFSFDGGSPVNTARSGETGFVTVSYGGPATEIRSVPLGGTTTNLLLSTNNVVRGDLLADSAHLYMFESPVGGSTFDVHVTDLDGGSGSYKGCSISGYMIGFAAQDPSNLLFFESNAALYLDVLPK